ncbi:MAG: hypothetical protein OHK0015_47910 [Chloroflexi bacterium OHK40]
MINPFPALGKALRDLFDEFLLLLVCNLVWSLLSLPLWVFAFIVLQAGAPLAASAIVLLGVLPAGPATIALALVAHRITDGRATSVGDYFRAMRQHARLGWLLTGLGVGGLLVILLNFGFYLGVNNIFGGLMLGLWLYLLIFWLGLMLYAFPLAFLQEEPGLRMIARNAFLMTVGRPVFTVITLLLMGILLLISAYLLVPALFITIAFLSVWSSRAARALIADARRRREEAESAPTTAPVEEKGRKGQVRPK